MKRALIVIAALVIVAGVLIYLGVLPTAGLVTQLDRLGINPFATETASEQRRVSPDQAHLVETGTVSSYIKATGNLEARDTASLSFEINGTVAEVLVKRGDKVQKGDVLARLDTTDLELSVTQAEISLQKAEADLAQVTADPDPDDLASARASLASAQASYDAVLQGTSEEEVTVAAASLRKAEVALQDAQAAYDKIAYRGDVAASSEATTLQDATIDYESALASYQMSVEDPTNDSILSAASQVAQAQATLNNLLEGSSKEDIEVAQANVKSAQLTLEQAQREMDQASLTARFSGTVTAVNTSVGERLELAGVIDLADLSELHIDVPVDEIDLPSVAVGQSATIVLDALPDVTIAGKVTAIAPSPTEDSGVVTYEVTVTLDEQQPGAVVGMTSNVSIETERHDNVVVIPADYVGSNSATGETYVNLVKPDGTVVKTVVELGIREDDNIEVVSGLSAGDRITTPTLDLTATTTSSQSGNGARMPMMMGGGGGRPPEGGGGVGAP